MPTAIAIFMGYMAMNPPWIPHWSPIGSPDSAGPPGGRRKVGESVAVLVVLVIVLQLVQLEQLEEKPTPAKQICTRGFLWKIGYQENPIVWNLVFAAKVTEVYFVMFIRIDMYVFPDNL